MAQIDFTPLEVQPEFRDVQQPSDVPTFTPLEQQPEGLEEPLVAADSYLGRLGSQLGERKISMEETVKDYLEGRISYPESILQVAGDSFGALFDTVGETALTILSSLTPDEAEKWLQEQIASGASSLMSTETAQQLYEAYRGLDKNIRKDIEAAINVGFGLVPGKSKVGKALVDSATESQKKTLAKYVLSQTPNAKQARIAERGLDKSRQAVLNREDAILNTVLSIKGISGSSSRHRIMESLNREVNRLGIDIRKELAGVKTQVPRGTVATRVGSRLKQFVTDNPEFVGKDLKPTFDKVIRAYDIALGKYSGNPKDLLKLRQEFDRVVEKFFKKDVHAGDDVSREVVAVVRNEINQLMQDIAPNANIRAAMNRQHHAMVAKENLGYNMAREGTTAEKVIRKIEQHPMLATSALTGGGMASNILGSEATGVGLGLLGGAYALSRPQLRSSVGTVLQNVPVGRSMLLQNQQEENVAP